MTQTRPAGRELAREARQQSRRPSKFLSHFYGTPGQREIDPAAKKKDRERLIAGLTIARRKLQLKCKFCFVFQPSFADKFYVSWAFFLHEQRVSLRLPSVHFSQYLISLLLLLFHRNMLSVLSDIIISRTELSF